jgi:hypothetical protein
VVCLDGSRVLRQCDAMRQTQLASEGAKQQELG